MSIATGFFALFAGPLALLIVAVVVTGVYVIGYLCGPRTRDFVVLSQNADPRPRPQ